MRGPGHAGPRAPWTLPAGALALALTPLALTPGCYLYHELEDDSGVRVDSGLRADAGARADAGSTRCGSGRCALVEPPRGLVITTSGLVGRVEAEVSGLRGVPEIDGVAFELDPCAPTRGAPCPSTLTIANAGADLAGPGVLAGAVETSIRDRMIIIRSDPCPGCDDGHEAGRLLFAAGVGELSEGFDLPLEDVAMVGGDEVCRSRGSIGEMTGRYELEVESLAPRVHATLDEGDTARLGLSDYAVRLVRSSYECVGPDLPPPSALAAAEWVIWIEGPR